MRLTASQELQKLLAATSVFEQYRMLREWETDAHNEAIDYALTAVRGTAAPDDLERIVDAVRCFRISQPFTRRYS
jgi:hypothetical protein